jgi:hypothetical protein
MKDMLYRPTNPWCVEYSRETAARNHGLRLVFSAPDRSYVPPISLGGTGYQPVASGNLPDAPVPWVEPHRKKTIAPCLRSAAFMPLAVE